jgi:pilus assembly protein CpaF
MIYTMTTDFQIEIQLPDKKKQQYYLSKGTYPLGSEEGNKIIIPDHTVSKKHALLMLHSDGIYLEDLNSSNGTYVNGKEIKSKSKINQEDKITVGNCVIVIKQNEQSNQAKESIKNKKPDTDIKNKKENINKRIVKQKSVIKKQIHNKLLERLDIKRLTVSRIQEKDLNEKVRETIKDIVSEVSSRLPSGIEPQGLIKEIYDEAVGLGPLEDLLANPEITEIMVNKYDQIYIEKNGALQLSDKMFMDDNSVLAIIERIVAPIGRRIDESQPYVDARLKDGSRVNAIIPPLSLTGPTVTIRKFSKEPFTIKNLINFGTVNADMAEFFKTCILLRKNIIVSGGTGSGKTTFLNVMGLFLPHNERIVTIEDSAELRLGQSHLIRLESRPPNIEGKGAITIRDLLRNALRMRPDRLIIGECRGGEALDMLQAMNTGHDGSMTTVHANSPRDVISRLETMVLMSGIDLPSRAIREQIASAVDLIIHTARLSDGSRKAMKVTEAVGIEGDRITMQDIFTFNQEGLDESGKVKGNFAATGTVPTFTEEIKRRGLSIDLTMFTPEKWNNDK